MDQTKPPDDPKPGEREYYTHRQTGDLGWKVIRDGKTMVKLDRPAYDDVRPFSDNEWVRKADLRPLIPAQVAQIAWVADRKLLLYLQQPEASKREWHELSEEKRKEWMERGPAKEGIRKMLWRGIMKTLEPLVEK